MLTRNTDWLRIGTFEFDAAGQRLRSAKGEISTLRPQTARVLEILIENAGRIVTKDQLMEEVWKGTFVTDDSLVQCISEIRRALGPEGAVAIATVPKKGYRLDLPDAADPEASRRRLPVWAFPVAALFMVLVVAAGWSLTPHPAAVANQAIAVMPFENIGGDQSQAYLAGGVTEDLIVSLSRLSDLKVAARGASFAMAEQGASPSEIAEALHVTHLLEGSVRRVGDNLRLTASLVDARQSENVWADSYEGSVDDIFAFQDSVLNDLTRVLSVRLSKSERERLGIRGTRNVEAYDSYLRGLELDNFLTRTANLDAEAAFAKAIRLDPDYAAPHAHMSLALSMRAEYDWTAEKDETVARSIRHADTAIELDPGLPFAHFARGRLLSRQFVGDKEGALAEFKKAIALDENYVDAYAFMAIVLVSMGRADEALPTIRSAFERNPFAPYWYYISLGVSNYYLGNYDAAVDAFNEVLARNSNSPHAMRGLIAAYGRLGNTDDAEWMAVEYESVGPVATIEAIMESSNIEYPPYRESFLEGLRMAGLPES